MENKIEIVDASEWERTIDANRNVVAIVLTTETNEKTPNYPSEKDLKKALDAFRDVLSGARCSTDAFVSRFDACETEPNEKLRLNVRAEFSKVLSKEDLEAIVDADDEREENE